MNSLTPRENQQSVARFFFRLFSSYLKRSNKSQSNPGFCPGLWGPRRRQEQEACWEERVSLVPGLGGSLTGSVLLTCIYPKWAECDLSLTLWLHKSSRYFVPWPWAATRSAFPCQPKPFCRCGCLQRGSAERCTRIIPHVALNAILSTTLRNLWQSQSLVGLVG